MRFLLLSLALLSPPLFAASLNVATAANFAAVARLIAQGFERDTGHRVQLAVGSTGKHYAQIVHGAPFDAFLAADTERPARLEREGRALAGSRITYAIGQLALWSPNPGLVDGQGNVLESDAFRHLAVANPRLAPYGLAASQVLQSRQLLDALRPRLVQGENIGQTFRFVQSGAAELGFVALSQALPVAGSYWLPPAELYDPIEQQAVLLRDTPQGRQFMAYLQSGRVRDIIRRHGYRTP